MRGEVLYCYFFVCDVVDVLPDCDVFFDLVSGSFPASLPIILPTFQMSNFRSVSKYASLTRVGAPWSPCSSISIDQLDILLDAGQ